jgi:hypothetical protein
MHRAVEVSIVIAITSSRVEEPGIAALRLNSQRRADAVVKLKELVIRDLESSRRERERLLLKREKSQVN